MLEKIKKLFKRGKDVAVAVPKVATSVIKEEFDEIKDLQITEVDNVQAELIASVAIAAMTSMGIPSSTAMREVIKQASAYCIRDFKQGCTNPQNLIVMRVINKVREVREARNLSQ